MKTVSQVVLLSDAIDDLEHGRNFYEDVQPGIGDYFYDTLISDIESLYLNAGIHPIRNKYHFLLSKRFPFAVYYEIRNDTAIVIAVLDMRRNPAWVRDKLQK